MDVKGNVAPVGPASSATRARKRAFARLCRGTLTVAVVAFVFSVSPDGAMADPVVEANSAMVLIPAGRFLMGSVSGSPDERPVHLVQVSAFYLDPYEVTNEEYRQFLLVNPKWQKSRVTSHMADDLYLDSWRGNSFPGGLGRHPVVSISWIAAKAYAEWRECRLPTEAEWEFTARGPLSNRFPWGNTPPDSGGVFLANYRQSEGRSDGYEKTAPVDAFSTDRSGTGIYGLAGNVLEFVADWYDPDYYVISSSTNPRGPPAGTYRTLRSGSWQLIERFLRSTNRFRAPPTFTLDQVGFRCARSETP